MLQEKIKLEEKLQEAEEQNRQLEYKLQNYSKEQAGQGGLDELMQQGADLYFKLSQ